MGLFARWERRRMEKNAQGWGKWCAKAMFFAFRVLIEQYKTTAPSYAWIARQTVLKRSHWKQIGETTLLFEKSGLEVEFSDEDTSLRSATHRVIEVEYGHDISFLKPWECSDMLRLAHGAADEYFASMGSK